MFSVALQSRAKICISSFASFATVELTCLCLIRLINSMLCLLCELFSACSTCNMKGPNLLQCCHQWVRSGWAMASCDSFSGLACRWRGLWDDPHKLSSLHFFCSGFLLFSMAPQANRANFPRHATRKTPERGNRTPTCPQVPWTEAMSGHQLDSPRLS